MVCVATKYTSLVNLHMLIYSSYIIDFELSDLSTPGHFKWTDDFLQSDYWHPDYLLVEWELWAPNEEEWKRLKRTPPPTHG